jgi:Tol biopolymer transport system component
MKKCTAAFLLFALIFNSAAQDDASNEKTLLKNSRQLIYEGARSGEGYFSASGQQLIFQSEREEGNPFYQIYMLDFETGDIHRVSPGTGKTTCAWIDWAGDNRVLYASTHHDPEAMAKQQAELDFRASGKQRRYSWDYDETMDIFSADRDGSNIVQLTDAMGYDAEGSYSPDGKHIAFTSLRDGYERELSAEEKKILEVDPAYFGEIYIMDADGSNIKRLTDAPGYDGGPFFSPDGGRIIWRRFDEDGMIANIYTMKLDGSDVQQITDFDAMSWAPYYHPGGDYVIFGSNKHGFGNFELFIVDAAGTKEPVRVTYTDGFDGLPVFSPDGKHLAWTSNRTANGKSQIFYAGWDHAAALDLLEKSPLRTSTAGNVQFSGDIDAAEITAKVQFLADDKLEGRMTGTAGNRMAAEYIIEQFKTLGMSPGGDNGTFMQTFPFISSVEVSEDGTGLSTTAGGDTRQWQLYDDYAPMPFSMNGEFSGGLVFAGYGIKTPEKADIDYNSYANIDVKGKAVAVLYDVPPHFDDEEKKELIRYATPRYKALMARELGASAIIFASPRKAPFNKVNKDNVPGNAGILALRAKDGWLDAHLEAKETSYEQLVEQFENYNPHVANEFEVEGLEISASVKLEKIESADVNVIGILKAGIETDEYIMIGGHYDHLGRGAAGSMVQGEDRNEIHNGADDNASGTAAVIELAEYFAQLKREDPAAVGKNLIYILWSGEELGLIGSDHYLNNPAVPLEKTNAYLNFDMVGMLQDNRLILQGLGSSSEWKKLIEKKNIMAGFNLALTEDPYVPTDAMSLYKGGVPILCFFTGIHDHYHRPSDDVERLDYEGIERITVFAANILKDMMKMDGMPYEKVEMSATRAASSRGFSIYLGTIPDYVAEVEGVKLSGVRPNGPADKAGVRGEDIIVKLAGKDIKNIYDYTYILADLKANEEVEMVVKRNGDTVKLTIVPEAK